MSNTKCSHPKCWAFDCSQNCKHMENTNKKAQPGSATYIETIYGTKTFARALMLDDAQSIMDLMDDYADHANKPYKSRISDLESILAGNTNYEQQLALESSISQLEQDLAKSQEKSSKYEGALLRIAECRNKDFKYIHPNMLVTIAEVSLKENE